MHDELWAGAGLKLNHAHFHFRSMAECLQQKRDANSVVQESSGAIVGGLWQEPFYAYLDAFLSATRSVPEVVNCCFGDDGRGRMKAWWATLDLDEQGRRERFSAQFDPHRQHFAKLPLSTARNISQHSVGYPDVEVTINGIFGVTHVGSPTKNVPLTEMRTDVPPELGWLARPRRIEPRWTDFKIDGQGLFEACQEYLRAAEDVLRVARGIADQVHGSKTLTPPRVQP